MGWAFETSFAKTSGADSNRVESNRIDQIRSDQIMSNKNRLESIRPGSQPSALMSYRVTSNHDHDRLPEKKECSSRPATHRPSRAVRMVESRHPLCPLSLDHPLRITTSLQMTIPIIAHHAPSFDTHTLHARHIYSSRLASSRPPPSLAHPLSSPHPHIHLPSCNPSSYASRNIHDKHQDSHSLQSTNSQQHNTTQQNQTTEHSTSSKKYNLVPSPPTP